MFEKKDILCEYFRMIKIYKQINYFRMIKMNKKIKKKVKICVGIIEVMIFFFLFWLKWKLVRKCKILG